MPQTIDVTGLNDEAIRAVQELVDAYRKRPPQPKGPPPGTTPEQLNAMWKAFVDSQTPTGVIADDSRESIYGHEGL